MNLNVTVRATGIIPEYAQILLTRSVGFFFLFLVLFQRSPEVGMIKILMFQTPVKYGRLNIR